MGESLREFVRIAPGLGIVCLGWLGYAQDYPDYLPAYILLFSIAIFAGIENVCLRRVSKDRYTFVCREVRHRVAILLWAPAALCLLQAMLCLYETYADCERQHNWRLVPRDFPGFAHFGLALVLIIMAFITINPLYQMLITQIKVEDFCGDCGYDLRGNPTGRTCPECGAPVHRTAQNS